jgi:ribosomal protein S18 acetylase RimI-like enzyme
VSVRVWIAAPDEAAEVARLLAAFRAWYGKDWPSDDAFRAVVARLIGRHDVDYVRGARAAHAAAAAVAQVRYRHSLWTDADDCWLEDLYVDDAARGAGLGRAMVEAVVARARERGCRRVELDVDDANTPARGLYEALGFGEKNGGSAFMQFHLD